MDKDRGRQWETEKEVKADRLVYQSNRSYKSLKRMHIPHIYVHVYMYMYMYMYTCTYMCGMCILFKLL